MLTTYRYSSKQPQYPTGLEIANMSDLGCAAVFGLEAVQSTLHMHSNVNGGTMQTPLWPAYRRGVPAIFC